MALVLPFVVTASLIWLVVTFIDTRVEPLIPSELEFLKRFPGGGLLIAVGALTIVGALAGNLVGRWIVDAADKGISNLPLVRSIYGGAKQVFKQVAAPERTSFKQAVLVEFPAPGQFAIGFVTNEDTAEVHNDTGLDLVAVYVPQAPIPTSGFLLYLPRESLKPLALPPDEALKRVISLGIIRDPSAVTGPDAK
ncbi:Mll0832 protein [alpha proteobacterium U9-1i]|nr:Mll0832 protein [alpha proteobacterium U9-1i]